MSYAQHRTVDLQREATIMNRDRFTTAEIAACLEISTETVRNLLREARESALQEIRKESKDRIDEEVAELYYLRSKLASDITAGDHNAIRLAIQISESLRKLLGLDNPQKHEHNINIREFVGFDPVAAVRGELDHETRKAIPQVLEGEIVVQEPTVGSDVAQTQENNIVTMETDAGFNDAASDWLDADPDDMATNDE